MTFRTVLRTKKLRKIFPDHLGIGFTITTLHIGDDPFEGVASGIFVSAIVDVTKLNLFGTTSAKNDFLVLVRKFLEWCRKVETIVF